jgi:hypothetical protein
MVNMLIVNLYGDVNCEFISSDVHCEFISSDVKSILSRSCISIGIISFFYQFLHAYMLLISY